MRSLPILQSSIAVQPRSVRLSLTDRCDLACIYCRPHRSDGYFEQRLDLDAWKTMVRGLIEAGVRRVRITGGEPLLHPQVVEMVGFLASATLPIEDIALTTNATRLQRLAKPLRKAGLQRINISLDSLDEARFARMTSGGRLADVLAGVDAALVAGFDEVKLNAVVLRGENDDELEAIAEWAWARGIVPRFLEVMAVGEGARLQDRVVAVGEMRARLAHLIEPGAAMAEIDRGPARYVDARHHVGKRVGFISGTSDTFCAGCDRLRVAADGMLRPCLATNDGLSASHDAQRGDASAVAAAVHEAWKQKPDGQTWKGCTEDTAREVSIRSIGG